MQRMYAAGRKVESLVWDDDYFKYDPVTNWATCQVIIDDRKPLVFTSVTRHSKAASNYEFFLVQ